MTTREMREERARIITEARGVVAAAEAEGRVLSAEEEARYDQLLEDADRLRATYERLERLAAAEAELGEPQDRRYTLRHGQPVHADAGMPSSETRSLAFAGWLLAGSDRLPTRDMLDAAARCGIDIADRRLTIWLDSRALPGAAIEQGTPRVHWDVVARWHAEQRESRQQSTATGPAGGFTVGDEAIRALEVALLRYGGVRQVAQIIRTETGADMPWPTLNDTATEGRILGQNVEATRTDMTFGQVVLGAYKYSSDVVLTSVEFLQDTSISVAEVIGDVLGQRIGRITNRHFTIGTGTGQPQGVAVAAAAGVTAAAQTVFTADELIDLEHTVDPEYRTNGSWMFRDTTLRNIKKMKDAEGRYLWLPGLAVREPDTILGYPYTVNQHMPAATAGQRPVLFGDFARYKVRDVREVTLLRLDERYAEFHQVAWLAFSRHDGRLVDAGTGPVRALTMAA